MSFFGSCKTKLRRASGGGPSQYLWKGFLWKIVKIPKEELYEGPDKRKIYRLPDNYRSEPKSAKGSLSMFTTRTVQREPSKTLKATQREHQSTCGIRTEQRERTGNTPATTLFHRTVQSRNAPKRFGRELFLSPAMRPTLDI